MDGTDGDDPPIEHTFVGEFLGSTKNVTWGARNAMLNLSREESRLQSYWEGTYTIAMKDTLYTCDSTYHASGQSKLGYWERYHGATGSW